MQEYVTELSSPVTEDMSVQPAEGPDMSTEVKNAKDRKRIEEAIRRAEHSVFTRDLLWEDGEHKCINSTSATETADPLPDAPPADKLPKPLVDLVNENPDLFKIITPIDPEVFREQLKNHPNRPFVTLVL